MAGAKLEGLRADEYDQRRTVAALRDRVFAGGEGAASIEELRAAEAALAKVEGKRAALEVKESREGRILSSSKETHLLGAESTGLVAEVTLRMAQVPTAIYHLFRKDQDPLISGTIQNRSDKPIRRLRVISRIAEYSVEAIDTLEIKQNIPASFDQLPTLLPGQAATVTELSRGTVSVMVEDLDREGTGIELHRTEPIWLLARTTAPFAVKDPKTGGWRDLTRYFGAFVTPNDPAVMGFLTNVRDAHPDHALVGYQGGQAGVEKQVEAVFAALKAKNVSYVNSTTAFSPEDGTVVQRVRLPAETLESENANCIDGTVLIVSLIEAISLNAAIVTMPGHAIVAWETNKGSDTWDYLDTTLIRSHDFAGAVARGRELAKPIEPLFASADETKYRRHAIRELRGQGITPTH